MTLTRIISSAPSQWRGSVTDTSLMAGGMTVAEPSYRVEKIANAHRVICACGWRSKFVPSEPSALGELERHRQKEHRS